MTIPYSDKWRRQQREKLFAESKVILKDLVEDESIKILAWLFREDYEYADKYNNSHKYCSAFNRSFIQRLKETIIMEAHNEFHETHKETILKYMDSEEFLDRIVNRIKIKQLK